MREFDLIFIKKILDKTTSGENPKVLGIDRTGIDTQFKSRYSRNIFNISKLF